jgi:hypothetical protein
MKTTVIWAVVSKCGAFLEAFDSMARARYSLSIRAFPKNWKVVKYVEAAK